VARVAFIGLGTMGLPMARNLLAAGHEVVGCDLDRGRVDELGAERAETAAGAAAEAEVAITSLPSPAAVEEVALALRGSGIEAFVDMSTSPPALARRLAEELGAEGIGCLDAPVSGGPQRAWPGTLTVMVGGDAETFVRVEPLLQVVGELVVRVGGPGAGQAAKLCNNLVAGATMTALAECCALAEREGIDPVVLYSVLTASTGDSSVLRRRFPIGGIDDAHPASHDFEALFTLDLIAKDLALALQLADEHGVAAPLAAAALERYRDAQAAGLGGLDYSAVYLAAQETARD
jgi:3-hydroxyisobutyrate dehydrogenase